MVPKLILDMFRVYRVRLEVVLFFGNERLFRKKLGPKKLIRDKFEFLRRLLMQELKQLVAGRVEPHQKTSPWWGHQNFMVRLHPKGSWMLARFFLKKESCALPKGSKHWGPVTWMDPKVGKPGIGFYKIETIACPAC